MPRGAGGQNGRRVMAYTRRADDECKVQTVKRAAPMAIDHCESRHSRLASGCGERRDSPCNCAVRPFVQDPMYQTPSVEQAPSLPAPPAPPALPAPPGGPVIQIGGPGGVTTILQPPTTAREVSALRQRGSLL